jgi:pimeloyl-ACP methyl ester carboxylesterase
MTVDMKTGLYYESTGPADAPTIVFLHGGGIGGWMWQKVVEVLSPAYHCLVPDLPEQGESLQVGPFSHAFAADCVADLIRAQAHGGKAHMVGLSEGAQIVVEMLSRHPEGMLSGISSSAILRPLPGQWMYTRSVFAWSYRLAMAPFKNNDGWIRLNMHGSAGIGDEYYPQFKKSFQQTTESGFTNLMYEAMHYRLPSGLEKVDLPVLVVAGQKEYKQMRQSALDLLHVLPQGRGAMLSLGAGSTLAKEHNWALTDPQLFAAAVRAWVEGKPLPAELHPMPAEVQ